MQGLNARNTEVAARRASALINAGRPAEARDVLRDALKIAPNDVRMSFMLAQAQRDAGDLEGAEATARALQAAHPDDVRDDRTCWRRCSRRAGATRRSSTC